MEGTTTLKPKDKKKLKRKLSAKKGPNLEANIGKINKPNENKRRKVIKQPDCLQTSKSEVNIDAEAEGSQQVIGGKKTESNRQRKRKKHEQLLAEKKAHADIASQQKALNYLSQWKHNKEEWKFEKLRQVWLQQNLFSSATIPDKYWETALEYFSSSKGQSRQSLIKEAMKVIETAEKDEEKVEEKDEERKNKDDGEDDDDSIEETDKEVNIKLDRAREILQHLQE